MFYAHTVNPKWITVHSRETVYLDTDNSKLRLLIVRVWFKWVSVSVAWRASLSKKRGGGLFSIYDETLSKYAHDEPEH